MLPVHLRVLYLHGFASSPASRKARFFAERLAALGIQVEIPDLAEGHFEDLTISRQLKLIEKVAGNEPIMLIGSSLGGYLAALYAALHPEVDRLLLLAPAFHFCQLWANELGPQRLAVWRENGTLPVFHYAEERYVPLGYQLMEDASCHPGFPDVRQPTLIFHGTQDPVVPVRYSAAFAETHANVRLVQLPSGHELTDVLDRIWHDAHEFLLPQHTEIQC